MVGQVLAAAARADQPDVTGWTMLHGAAFGGQEGVVAQLPMA